MEAAPLGAAPPNKKEAKSHFTLIYSFHLTAIWFVIWFCLIQFHQFLQCQPKLNTEEQQQHPSTTQKKERGRRTATPPKRERGESTTTQRKELTKRASKLNSNIGKLDQELIFHFFFLSVQIISCLSDNFLSVHFTFDFHNFLSTVHCFLFSFIPLEFFPFF